MAYQQNPQRFQTPPSHSQHHGQQYGQQYGQISPHGWREERQQFSPQSNQQWQYPSRQTPMQQAAVPPGGGRPSPQVYRGRARGGPAGGGRGGGRAEPGRHYSPQGQPPYHPQGYFVSQQEPQQQYLQQQDPHLYAEQYNSYPPNDYPAGPWNGGAVEQDGAGGEQREQRQGGDVYRAPNPSAQPPQKAKSQERILPKSESPVVVAWDNPFPVFNTKNQKQKSEGKKSRTSSPEKANPRRAPSSKAEQRSQIPPGHRPTDHDRPRTSQSNRRPEKQLPNPGAQRANAMSPTSLPSSIVPSPVDECRSPVDRAPHSAGPNQQVLPMRHASDFPAASNRSAHPVSPAPGPQRSMTMPEEVIARHTQEAPSDSNAPAGHQQNGGPRRPQELRQNVSSPVSPLASPSSAPAASDNPAPPNRTPSRPAEISPVPNFDAISPSATERNEDPLNQRPAYQKPAYIAASIGFTPIPRSQTAGDLASAARPPLQEQQQHQQQQQQQQRPDFADFSFDLPQNERSHQSPPSEQQQSYEPMVSPSTGGPYDGRVEYEQPPYNRWPGNQYPVRSESAPGPPNAYPTADTSAGYRDPRPPPARQLREDFPAQQYPPGPQYRPATAPQDVGYDYDRAEYDHSLQGHWPRRPAAAPLPRDPSRFPTNQTEHPKQPYAAQMDRRPSPFQDTPLGAEGPRRAGSTPPSQPQAGDPGAPINPDALPAHPVPVRPGLLRKTTANPTPSVEQRGLSYSAPTVSSAPIRNGPPAEPKPPPVTINELNSLSQKVKNNSNDKAAAMVLVKKLVEAASVLANEGGKADGRTTQKNRERYLHDAHKHLKKLVHKGDGDATFYLAECHGHGTLGLPVDGKEAFHLYQSAAKGGHAQAAYRVAVCYEMGSEEGGGTRRDPIKAVQWYKRAAGMGDAPAMYKMGIIQLKGLLGQERNPREALSWLKRAADRADRENPHALHELGLLHENATASDAVVRDEVQARQLFTQAADLGYKYSQFRLGSAHEYGLLGCPIDARHSIAWYTQAAAQGEHQAELALSGWYLTGAEGILQQSDTEAYLWARKAAGSGLAKAEYAMGYFTETGIGCTANLDEAKKWYWRAASQNFPKARQRLEELKKGGGKMQKTRVSRSAMDRQNEGDCRVM